VRLLGRGRTSRNRSGRFPAPDLVSYTKKEIMDEHHLAARQIAAFILGGLDEDELEDVCRHFDECGECVGWLA